ncbi:MAG: SprB repeat-containing protein, partial [Saprospiraceae bacterium]|nr:SprB repeat-containing protein [Saprospiraceae bacterium]
MRKINLVLLFLCCAGLAQAQYSETFTGQNGKGLVDAICPAGTTNISNCGSACTVNATDNTSTCTTVPVSFTGVNWSIVKGPAVNYFTDLSGFGFEFTSPDDFGVVGDQMQIDDTDNELCWLSPTLNIGAAGAVSISVAVSQTGGLESSDYIKAEYSLNGGSFVQFGNQTGAFAATTLSVSGLTGSTLVIRICALTNGGGEQIFFDNVSVPQTGVTTGCTAPTLSRTAFPTGSCNPTSGSIQVTASGGTPGYNVAWSGPSSGNPGGTEIAASNGSYTISPLAAGTYSITVTDAASCSATTTATVGTATAMSLSTQVLPASCNSVDDGEIDLTVSNGVAPYTYSWDNLPGGGDPQDQTDLAPGTYFVTVTDNAGCVATTSATISVAAPGAYSESFSIAGKGILDGSTCSGASGTTCTNNNFTGVNWTIYGLSNLTGVDIGDYFKTTGGVLQALDMDQIVCWESPELDINPPGAGVGFSVALSWVSFDQEPAGSSPADNIGDHLDVEYSLNGGAWQRVSNQVGGGLTGHTISYVNGSGNDLNGSTTVNVSGLSGSTLRIRVCGLINSDLETFSIDNVSVPLAQGLACPQEINLK